MLFAASTPSPKTPRHGISGSVAIVETRSGDRVAIKTYHPKEKYEHKSEYHQRVLREYATLRGLNHPNIIAVLKTKVSFTGSVVKMYMEAGVMDFKQYLGASSPPLPATLVLHFIHLYSAVEYLHTQQNLCHRDLKLENLVLSSDAQLKLIDFDTCAAADKPAVGLVGTKVFVAPEVFLQISYNGALADVWSLGIILYYFLLRRYPWRQASHSDPGFAAYERSCALSPETCGVVYQKEDSGTQAFFLSLGLAPGPVSLLEHVLTPDPALRYAIADFHRIAWFRQLSESPPPPSAGVSAPSSQSPQS